MKNFLLYRFRVHIWLECLCSSSTYLHQVSHAGSGPKRQTLMRWKMFLFKEKLVQTGREKLDPNSNLEGFKTGVGPNSDPP